MNLKNTHKEIYQRLSKEDIELFDAVNEENAPITFDEYYERNDFASAIEEIMLINYGGKTLLEWRRENDVEDDCTESLDCAYSGLPSPLSYTNEKIEVPCSVELDNEWYYESM